MTTKTNIAGIELKGYVFNASGPICSSLEELKKIAISDSAAITMKTCTIEPRRGNEEPRYARLPFGAIQCMGLPNVGYKKYIEFAAQLKKYNPPVKPIIASIAGFSLEEYITLMQAFQKSSVDLIEVNLSCPNLEGRIPVAYDFIQTANILSKILSLGKKPVGLKLPPYYCLMHQKEIAHLIMQHDVGFIACINSLGNALAIDSDKEAPVLMPNRGVGALSGSYIKPLALANVRNFYELFNGQISIIDVGGIVTGTDAFEFLLAGADAVQIATTFEKEGLNCFERIDAELEEVLKRKGYSSIQEVKGKLNYV